MVIIIIGNVFFVFGQVKVKGEDVTFALKVIKKKHVVDSRQEEHIHSERRILAEASSPFVVRSRPRLKFALTNICTDEIHHFVLPLS